MFEKIEGAYAAKQLQSNPVDAFHFQLVTRFMDELSGFVRYTLRIETILSVPIPLELCTEVTLKIILNQIFTFSL